MHRWGAVAVGLVGALIIIQPGVVPLNAGVLAMAAAVPLFAASDLFVKALVRTESPTVIIAVLNLILSLGIAPFAWWFCNRPMGGIGLAAGMAVFATVSHICMAKRLPPPMSARSNRRASCNYRGWLFSVISPSPKSSLAAWIGAAVIIASVTHIMYRERLKAAPDARA